MEERLVFASALAREAGAMIKAAYGSELQVHFRSNGAPVTNVDAEINDYVVRRLKRAFPADRLLSEEGAYGPAVARYTWVCDPVDGVKALIQEIPSSVFIIGLRRGRTMVLAVVYDPYADKLYHAIKDGGAFCNGAPIRVNTKAPDSGFVLAGADSYSFHGSLGAFAKELRPALGVGHKCMMIASGQGIGMVNDTVSLYDLGPCALIVAEAGGKVTNLQGKPLDFTGSPSGVIVSNGATHQELVDLVQASRGVRAA